MIMNIITFQLKGLSEINVRVEISKYDSTNYGNGVQKGEILVRFDLMSSIRSDGHEHCNDVDQSVKDK